MTFENCSSCGEREYKSKIELCKICDRAICYTCGRHQWCICYAQNPARLFLSLNDALGLFTLGFITHFAVGECDDLYVADTYKDRILIFGSDKKLIRLIEGRHYLHNPVFICPTSSSERRHSIVAAMLSIKILAEFPPGLVSLCASYVSCEVILVTELAENRVQLMDPTTGKCLAWAGGRGHEESQVLHPSSCFVDRDGNWVVADTDNNRIQIFSPSGSFIRQIPNCDRPAFAIPYDDGSILFGDPVSRRFKRITHDGVMVDFLPRCYTEQHVRPTPMISGQVLFTKEGHKLYACTEDSCTFIHSDLQVQYCVCVSLTRDLILWMTWDGKVNIYSLPIPYVLIPILTPLPASE